MADDESSAAVVGGLICISSYLILVYNPPHLEAILSYYECAVTCIDG